jgi:hypothetical protein
MLVQIPSSPLVSLRPVPGLALGVVLVLSLILASSVPALAQEADLSVTKGIAEGPTSNSDGTTNVLFGIEVCNAGPDENTGYTFQDQVLDNLTGAPPDCSVSYSFPNAPANSQVAGNTLTVTENLAAGSCQTFFVSVDLGEGCTPADLENCGEITNSAPGDPNSSDNRDCAGPLPVEMSGFSATADGAAAVLSWTTLSETNNDGFYVEHRPSSGTWREVGFVNGAGTTTSPQPYRFRTEPLAAGTHAFRLRQVDVDGTPTLTDPRTVAIQLDDAFAVRVGPSPFRSTATVQLQVRERQSVSAHLYDILGRRVQTLHTGPLAPGTWHEMRVDGTALANGTYLLRVTGDTFTATEQIVRAR